MSNNGTITRPGVSAETLRAAGVYLDSADPEPGSTGLPYFDITGNPRSDGFQRWRLPKVRPDGQKYHQLAKTGLQTYFPPRALTWTEVGGDLVIVEGEFKALSLIDAGIHAIGLGGLTTYTNDTSGKPQLLAGIAEAVAHWKPERVLYLGDSDTATNFEFSRNASFLSRALEVPVLLPRIPMGAAGKGIDDVRESLGSAFRDFWREIVEKAEATDRKDRPGQLSVRLLRREEDYLRNLAGRERDRALDRVVKMIALCDDAIARNALIEVASGVFGIAKAVLAEAAGQRSEEAADNGREKPKINGAPGESGLPVLILPGGEVSITQASRDLFLAMGASGRVFFRGGAIATLQRSKEGEVEMRTLEPTAARSFIEAFVEPWAWRVRGGDLLLKRVITPLETASAMLACHVAAEILPNVTGLVNCPIITEIDGELRIVGKGHSPETGLLIQHGEAEKGIALTTAVSALRKLLADFAFATPGDESRAMASFLTPALKMGGLIAGNVPCDVAEANVSQSGKTFRQRLVSACYGERSQIVTLRKGGVGSVDEGLAAKLVAGRPFIMMDNFRGVMDSAMLECLLTAEREFPCRLPHQREVNVDPSRFFLQLSSNGVESTPDMANRSCIIRIRRRDGVEFPDTLGEVRTHQGFYLGCIFSVIREWHRLGKPRTAEARHDFRGWCRSLDWIVQNIFGMSPIMEGHREAQQRTANPILSFLRAVGIELERLERLGEPLGAAQLAEIAGDASIAVPGLRDGCDDDGKAARVLGGKMGSVFKEQEIIEVDGFTIARHEEIWQRTEGGGKMLKKYVFARTPHQRTKGHQGCTKEENTSVFYNVQALVRLGAESETPPPSASSNEDGEEWARLL